jgi:hypothetical protein
MNLIFKFISLLIFVDSQQASEKQLLETSHETQRIIERLSSNEDVMQKWNCS